MKKVFLCWHFFSAKQIVENLNEEDKLAVLAISNDWTSPLLNEDCPLTNQVPSVVDDLPKFTPVTPSRKKLFYNFIDGMYKGSGATNHSLGLQKALKVIEKSQIQNETVMILYISRGLLSSLTEAKTVLETIQQASENISCPFVINTCAVIDDSRPTIYETQFLEDIALQNYNKHNISYTGNVLRGIMIPINSTDTVGFALTRFYNVYSQNTFNLQKEISLPTWDKKSNGKNFFYTNFMFKF